MRNGFLSRSTLWRLCYDWLALLLRILRYWPDIVHLNPGLDVTTFRSLRRDAVNLLIARALGRRVLVFWRGWQNHWCGRPEFPGGNKGVLSRIYRLASAHIVLSERFKEDLMRWGFGTPIHVETTVVADELVQEVPRQPDKNAVAMHLLYLSRVEVGKGVFELLDAYKLLKVRNPGYTLTIAGDGPALEALKVGADELGLRDVHFPGFLSGQRKIDCFRNASVFCFLSYTEGMPNAVLEAMAMGLPIVSSDAGGLRDILQDGVTGFIVPPLEGAPEQKRFDPMRVADAIERLVNDPESCARISRQNAHYARERFAAPKVAQRLESIYTSVLAPGPLCGVEQASTLTGQS